MRFDFDVIVIGAGHAGCEAASASARLGASTLLITSDMNRIAQMSCNPAIGGIAKGQIVREIDALGGMMGIIADRTAIQFRMLNRSKGPAVWSPRVQSDRTRYIDAWRQTLDSTPNLSIYQDTVNALIFDENAEDGTEGTMPEGTYKPKVAGVKTDLGLEFHARKVILTAGTFLNGLMHFGATKIEGGRISECSAHGLTEQLMALGFQTDRMKTGTPMRIDGKSIDYTLVERQSGDDEVIYASTETDRGCNAEVVAVNRDFHKFSFLPDVQRELLPKECFIVHTNTEVHEILRDNLDSSPMYNGDIRSIGPRYCPSIETKIVTFADKDSHQLFLEPEGETTSEFYVNGFSSSLPWKVQFDAISKVPALKDVQIYRPGYAIEYDFFPPTQLTHDLQTKLVEGLYFAGQVNGTTGYEEAAGQGLIAGINAARSLKNLEPLVLKRDQAYLGVLIDDLVTKGVDEPYRMFTSRAEYRILLRQDDADMRLTPIGYEIGLAKEARYRLMQAKKEERDALIDWCEHFMVKVNDQNNSWLTQLGTSPLTASTKLVELVKRPQLTFANMSDHVPKLKKQLEEIRTRDETRCEEIIESAEILIKYGGYIERERQQAEKTIRLDYVRIPKDMDYEEIKGLSTEARQKLDKIRPETIGQASRIPGVSPADISIMLLMLGR